ncbi:hypothetical protein MKEN_01264300 [Mycena kentingensis (nom. inval.)]|nr:hypothetical protein MKEN_01264300 [Mycena kentingensis (nom. inval.)]
MALPFPHHNNGPDASDSDDDHNSVASLPPFTPPQSTRDSETSYERSTRSSSPTPSVWSVTSSMRESALRREYGRQLNNYSEVYRLPADQEEQDRLNSQHAMFIEVMGEYPPCLPEVMRDDVPGERKAILDLGCGTGAWIMERARQFPNCFAVAVDLVPMQSLSEVDDINLGLEHFYGDFNVVHAQLISSGIKDYLNLINQMAHCLRPGGLLDLMEFDFSVYDHMPDGNHRRCPTDTSTIAGPWFARWMAFANAAARDAGGHPDAATHLQQWLLDHPLLEDVVYRDFWIPVSPHPSFDHSQRRIGTQMRDDILAFLKSGRPLLLGSGVPESIVDELQLNAEHEASTAANGPPLNPPPISADDSLRSTVHFVFVSFAKLAFDLLFPPPRCNVSVPVCLVLHLSDSLIQPNKPKLKPHIL